MTAHGHQLELSNVHDHIIRVYEVHFEEACSQWSSPPVVQDDLCHPAVFCAARSLKKDAKLKEKKSKAWKQRQGEQKQAQAKKQKKYGHHSMHLLVFELKKPSNSSCVDASCSQGTAFVGFKLLVVNEAASSQRDLWRIWPCFGMKYWLVCVFSLCCICMHNLLHL